MMLPLRLERRSLRLLPHVLQLPARLADPQ
jgi:hypothetical protein